MKPCIAVLLAACLFLAASAAPAQRPDEPNEGLRFERDGEDGLWRLSWWARAGRTYFIQYSHDLSRGFTYMPVIEPGADSVSEREIDGGTGSQFFLRLQYSDIPADDPWAADFDGDQVGNWEELTLGGDPLGAADADQDGLPDDWELRIVAAGMVSDTDGNGSVDVGDVSPEGDADGDGGSNEGEFRGGSDPTDPGSTPGEAVAGDGFMLRVRGLTKWSGCTTSVTLWEYYAGPYGGVSLVSDALLEHWSSKLQGPEIVHSGFDYRWEPYVGEQVATIWTMATYYDEPDNPWDTHLWPLGSGTFSDRSGVIAQYLGQFVLPEVGEGEDFSKWARWGARAGQSLLNQATLASFYKHRPAENPDWFDDIDESAGSGEYQFVMASDLAAEEAMEIGASFLLVERWGDPDHMGQEWQGVQARVLHHTFHVGAGSKHSEVFSVSEGLASTPPTLAPGETYRAELLLLPFEIEGYKRGIINSPGAKVPKGSGEYGQETVMMENADSDDNTTQPDYATTAVDAAADDDLVKVVLRWPKDLKISGVKLELKHKGLEVDPTKTTDADKYKEVGTSRLNFYKPDGTKLTDADLKIDDLGTPGTGYLAEILTTGELTLFVEGAENFGNLGLTASKMKLLGGAMLNFEVTHNGTTSRARLLVYRGGFLVFRQPNGQPGQAGTFEFWDGKGRVKNKSGGYQNEFQEDVTDWGAMLESWTAKSGKPNGSADYRTGGGKGYTPPGWWWAVENQLAATEQQLHKAAGYIQNRGQANEKWNQAAFNRWQQDDAPAGQRYTANYVCDKSIAHDAQIGQPTFIEFKFRLFAIPPSTPYSRTGLLIHPDGKKDGTLGCIGLQTWDGCNGAAKVLRRYHGLKLKVQHN